MSRTARLALVLAVCVVAGWFAGRALWAPPGGGDPAPPPPPAAEPLTTVPDFSLEDLATGQPRSVRDWNDQGLVLNFWATWCAPCRKEMPLLEQVHQQHAAAGIAIVGVAIDRVDPVRTFIGETGVSYPVLVGQQNAMEVAESLAPGFVGLPLTIVAAPGGEILQRHMGELHPGDLDLIVTVLQDLRAGRIDAATARQRLERD